MWRRVLWASAHTIQLPDHLIGRIADSESAHEGSSPSWATNISITSLGIVEALFLEITVALTPTQQLLTSANYALLAYSGITNTGSSLIGGGNIGSYPTTSITGFPPGTFVSPAAIDNAHAQQAEVDALAAYNAFAAMTFTSLGASSVNLSTSGNGSSPSTYKAGNYSAGSSMDIPTSITLDAQGNPNAIFIFKAASTITLESGASVLLINGAVPQNVVWIVGSSFTSVYNGSSSVMQGTIIANNSITLGGGQLNGRALAGVGGSSGAVTIAAALSLIVPAAVIPVAPPVAPGTSGGPTQNCLISRNLGAYINLFSVPYAWPQVNTNQFLDLVQIVDQGDNVILNVNYAGVVNYPAVLPTNGTKIGVFYTRLLLGTVPAPVLLSAVMADAFTDNPAHQDIIQVINEGGAISYWWDYLGVAHGQ